MNQKYGLKKCIIALVSLFFIFGCSNNINNNIDEPEKTKTPVNNPDKGTGLVITGKAPTVNSNNNRATENNDVYDVTNYFTINDGILRFDTVRGPLYTIDLINKEIIDCTSENAIMSKCDEISDGIWEITLYSNEFPKTATYKFDEKYKTTNTVSGCGGTASDEYEVSIGEVEYSDNSYEIIELNKTTGIVKLNYGKDGIDTHYCNTTIQNLLEYGLCYIELEKKDSNSSDNNDDKGWISLDNVDEYDYTEYHTDYFTSDFGSIISFSNGRSDWAGTIYYSDSEYKNIKCIDFDGSDIPSIIVDAETGDVVYYTLADTGRLSYRVRETATGLEVDIKSYEYDYHMDSYFTIIINKTVTNNSSNDTSDNEDEILVIVSSNGEIVAKVVIPTDSYGECEVKETTIPGLTCEGQYISETQYAISTYIDGEWIQNKHLNWISPENDSGGQNISGSGEGGSPVYNIRYEFENNSPDIPSGYLYSYTDKFENVTFNVYSYTSEMKGIYFNSINPFYLYLYVDDLAEGDNSIYISILDDIVGDGFNVSHPGNIYLKSVQTIKETSSEIIKLYEISTYYYDCTLCIEVIID